MIRNSLLVAVVALLWLAPRGFAQDQVGAYLDSPPSPYSLDGIYTGPYSATYTSGEHQGFQTKFICDDFGDEASNQNVTYNVTPFSSLPGSLGQTLWGHVAGAMQLYEEVGWLTLQMILPQNNNGTAMGQYSYAIWAVFAPGAVQSWLDSHGDSSTWTTVSGLLSQARANYSNGNYSSLVILTPVGCAGKGGGFCAGAQEFVVDPQALGVPEGGSAVVYLLLAGIPCFAALFYSRRQTAKGRLA